MKISISREDYLKAVGEGESSGQTVTAATLAAWLEVSPAAVSMALKRLSRDGLAEVDDQGVVHLAGEGKAIAERLMRRHYLLERMLTEVFDFEWYKVHDEAERLEHAISDDFERKLLEMFGESGTCPHGNFLGPDTPQDRRERGWIPLKECPDETAAEIKSVYERDRALLERLDSLGLRIGATLTVKNRNWDDTMTLMRAETEVVLGIRAAELIWVAPFNEPEVDA
jgi:DtxR family transcriptional regulator, Mn-dependent transcriptional regulator